MKMDKMKAMPEMEEDSKYCEDAVKCAMHKMMEAEEIKQDPKMMALVKKHAAKQKKTISSIAELKEKSAELEEAEEA